MVNIGDWKQEFLSHLLVATATGPTVVLFTNPLEVVKVRMQMQGAPGCPFLYRNVMHAFYVIPRREGIFALQQGLLASMTFQSFYNFAKLGIYQVAENHGYTKKSNGDFSPAKSMTIASMSGALGAFVYSPLNMIKVKSQGACGRDQDRRGSIRELIHIAKHHGIKGLWRGSRICTLRLAWGSGIQLTTFSEAKGFLKLNEISASNPMLQALYASCVSGFCLSAGACPLDVILTRIYNQPTDENGKGVHYSGLFDCAAKILKNDGIAGFYRGFGALFVRSGPQTVLTLVFWEKYKLMYDDYFT